MTSTAAERRPRAPPTGSWTSSPGTPTPRADHRRRRGQRGRRRPSSRFAADTGVRLTFFPNGAYRSWEDNAAALQPLVDSGQIALGNNTWSQPDLTTLSDAEVAERSGATGLPARHVRRTGHPVLPAPVRFPRRADRPDRRRPGSPDGGDVERHLQRRPGGDGCGPHGGGQRWFAAQAIRRHANQPAITTIYDELLAISPSAAGPPSPSPTCGRRRPDLVLRIQGEDESGEAVALPAVFGQAIRERPTARGRRMGLALRSRAGSPW